MKRLLLASSMLLAVLPLASCGDPNTNIFQKVGNLFGGCTNGWPTPAQGQWVTSNCNQVSNNQITFNNGQVSGYYYTNLGVIPKVGQTLSLTYTLTGNNPVFQQQQASGGNAVTDVGPPTNSLLIMQKGDNLSCAGDYNFYRLFPRTGKTNLTLGTHTISAVLSGTNWQGCDPDQVLTDARLQTTLNNN